MFRIRRAMIFAHILYKIVERLIGLKSATLEGAPFLGMSKINVLRRSKPDGKNLSTAAHTSDLTMLQYAFRKDGPKPSTPVTDRHTFHTRFPAHQAFAQGRYVGESQACEPLGKSHSRRRLRHLLQC